MSMETVITSLISLAGGILVGILGSKLVLLLLLKLIRLPAAFGFEIGIQAIITCLEVYGVIFADVFVADNSDETFARINGNPGIVLSFSTFITSI